MNLRKTIVNIGRHSPFGRAMRALHARPIAVPVLPVGAFAVAPRAIRSQPESATGAAERGPAKSAPAASDADADRQINVGVPVRDADVQ